MNSKAYNLIWISPQFQRGQGAAVSASPEEMPFPIPQHTVENMLAIAKRNSDVDVRLWIDPRRLTPSQEIGIRNMASLAPDGNLGVHDLLSIQEYRDTPLYNFADLSPNWRNDKHSLIWRQVDAAKILICLQGDYDQVFYSDADIVDLTVNSPRVQQAISKYGLITQGKHAPSTKSSVAIENQVFGFNQTRRPHIRHLYNETLYFSDQNGYLIYLSEIEKIAKQLGIESKDLSIHFNHDGTNCRHPGLLQSRSPEGTMSSRKSESPPPYLSDILICPPIPTLDPKAGYGFDYTRLKGRLAPLLKP